MTLRGVYGPRRFGAFGGVFELVGLGAGGGAGGKTCTGAAYCLGLASSLRLASRSSTWVALGAGLRGLAFVG